MKKTLLLVIACVAGCATAFAQTADTTVKFTVTTHDFGELLQSDGPQTYAFEFTNIGTAPVLVQNVQPSCGCTTPGWTKEPVEPGQTGVVQATYNAASVGPFNKSLTVTTNGSPATITLYIKGKVITGDTAATE
ncbi:MAG: DUF1573 domain-containing protein [Prevotellaceae bacterium]|jgi:hypothetical protein|nr:DUF1573 domain-containing protein [Prevotellaceae bacterium]